MFSLNITIISQTTIKVLGTLQKNAPLVVSFSVTPVNRKNVHGWELVSNGTSSSLD